MRFVEKLEATAPANLPALNAATRGREAALEGGETDASLDAESYLQVSCERNRAVTEITTLGVLRLAWKHWRANAQVSPSW